MFVLGLGILTIKWLNKKVNNLFKIITIITSLLFLVGLFLM